MTVAVEAALVELFHPNLRSGVAVQAKDGLGFGLFVGGWKVDKIADYGRGGMSSSRKIGFPKDILRFRPFGWRRLSRRRNPIVARSPPAWPIVGTNTFE